jgi:hypothetical protein
MLQNVCLGSSTSLTFVDPQRGISVAFKQIGLRSTVRCQQ